PVSPRDPQPWGNRLLPLGIGPEEGHAGAGGRPTDRLGVKGLALARPWEAGAFWWRGQACLARLKLSPTTRFSPRDRTMKRLLLPLLALPLLATGPAAGPPKGAANTVELNGHIFTLPPGFTIELVAGPPVVDRPVAIDFDEQGRLYVTEVSGNISRDDVQQQKKTHRVLRLESTKGDGKFDKRTVFADQMAFLEGVMYYKGSVYVAAPPSIWKLTDTACDGVADQRIDVLHAMLRTGAPSDMCRLLTR